jgi:2-keto-4-pentenoate hydratase/2-oxohepta-3-ene-1,7-dioic acid hydratase in catechol pathway
MSAAMLRPRLASFIADGRRRYGLLRDDGVVDLWRVCGWRSLRAAIEANALRELVETGARKRADFAVGEFAYDLPVAQPEKPICVGVNYPDRNEEYKDGAPAPTLPGEIIKDSTIENRRLQHQQAAA